VTATHWREREAALRAAASILGVATNDRGLSEAVDPAPRRFHNRDIWVIGAERFTSALTKAIGNDDMCAVLAGLGHRRGTTVGMLPGTIDQAVDSADILCHPHRCRSTASALGLLG
jgi:hypothetical protein